MRFKKILVGIDFSEASRAAFDTATAMAADSGAELVLVHIVQTFPYPAGIPPIPIGTDTPGVRQANEDIELLVNRAKHAGARLVSARVVNGVPWHELVELLKNDPSFDLAIVATHGHTGIKHVLIGSVAEKLVRHAPCPVLVVRGRD